MRKKLHYDVFAFLKCSYSFFQCLSIIKSDKFTKRKDIVVEPIIATPIPQCRDHDLNLMCGVIGQNALENAAEATRSKLEHALIPIAIRVQGARYFKELATRNLAKENGAVGHRGQCAMEGLLKNIAAAYVKALMALYQGTELLHCVPLVSFALVYNCIDQPRFQKF